MSDLFNPDFFGGFKALDLFPKSVNIVGWDTEDDTKGKPLAFSFFDGGAVLKKKYFYTTSAEEAVKFIYNYPVQSYFISHNLEYDIVNLFKHAQFAFIDEIVKAPLMLQVSMVGTKHVLMNSMSYFKGSLKAMGKVIGIEKMEGKGVNQFNKEYAIRDAEIVWAYMDKFQKSLVQDFNVPLSLSIGSIAMQTYRNTFMDSGAQVTYNNPLLVNKAYYGGRVEVFYRGVTPDGIPVHECDINSSYPNVMRNYEYPDTEALEESRIDTHKFGIGHFKMFIPDTVYIPILPLKSASGRLFFPVGEITGYWTYAEVRKAISQGAKIVKEFDGVGTNKGCKPFFRFVEYFYGKRFECKEKLDRDYKDGKPEDFETKFMAQLLKDLQNNLYGKFAQKKAKTKMSRRPIPRDKLLKQIGEYDERKTGEFFEYVQKNPVPPKTANYMWGLHVTAYARLELLKHMETVLNNGGQLLYCDTDSIFFTGESVVPHLPLSNTLGDLSHKKYDKGIFRQAKGYLLCNARTYSVKTKQVDSYEIKKVACKGVATTHAYEFIVEGLATSVKPMRFKEALLRTSIKENAQKVMDKEIGFNVWRDVEKAMQSIDIKRSGGFGKTNPVNASKIEYLEENACVTAEDWSNKLSSPIFREAKEDYFRNVVIPENWFKETGIPKELFEGVTKDFFIRREDLRATKDGEIWFSADVECETLRKDKKYLYMTLNAYFGQFFDHRSIKALIHPNTLKAFLPKDVSIIGKRIILRKDEDGSVNFEVFTKNEKISKMSRSKFKPVTKSDREEHLKLFLEKRKKYLEN